MQPVRIYQGRAPPTSPLIAATTKRPKYAQLLAEGKPLAGPVDHAVPVMSITDMQSSTVAIVFGYACHPTTSASQNGVAIILALAQLEIEQSFSHGTSHVH